MECKECKGKCCRDDLGYKVAHMASEFYCHACEHCDDGTSLVGKALSDEEVAYLGQQLDDTRKALAQCTLAVKAMADDLQRQIVTEADRRGLVFMEPRRQYDRCVVGIMRGPKDQWPRDPEVEVVAYSTKLVVDVLMDEEGMDYEEAVEWVDFNVTGGWHGGQTPTFVDDL